MQRQTLKIIFLSFLVLATIYLLLPGPTEPPPLPNSYKSTEPGDTVEIPGLFAYYTNLSRNDAVSFYERYFSRSSFLGISLPTYRLNHPPEYTWTVIRDTVHSSFLEELVHPFRESWYINGYEPANDPFLKNGQKMGNFEFNGQVYTSKIMVLRKTTNPLLRLVIFSLSLLTLFWLIKEAKATYESFRYHR